MSEIRAMVAAAVLVALALGAAVVFANLWQSARVELALANDDKTGLEAQLEAQHKGADERCETRLDLQKQQHRIALGAERSKLRICLEADRTAERLEADPGELVETYRNLLGYETP